MHRRTCVATEGPEPVICTKEGEDVFVGREYQLWVKRNGQVTVASSTTAPDWLEENCQPCEKRESLITTIKWSDGCLARERNDLRKQRLAMKWGSAEEDKPKTLMDDV